MARIKTRNVDFPAWGLSPLGGNAQEGTATGFAAVRNTEVMGVPLEYDPVSGEYVSKLALIEQEDKRHAEALAQKTREDESFRQRAGFKRSV